MEIFILIVAVFLIIGIIASIKKPSKIQVTRNIYKYFTKGSILTKTELKFYENLKIITDERWAIIPQAHLSSFIEHKVKGQSWKGAFSRINGKSIDFLICNKKDLSPIYAIELDDYTHERKDRIDRDSFVNELFEQIQIPIIRFKEGEWETPELINRKISQEIV